MEDELKKIWATVLDRKENDLSSDADFFQEGGDSVSAIKLADLASKSGIHLPAQTIFENSILKAMAQAAEADHVQKKSGQPHQADPLSSYNLLDSWRLVSNCLNEAAMPLNDLEDIYKCTPFQSEIMRSGHELGTWVFQAVFEVSAESIERAKRTIELVRAQNPTFRSRIVQVDGSLYHLISKEPISWQEEHGRLETVRDKQRAERMCYGDPLCRYVVVHDDERTFMVWTLSHAIYDRWSKVSTLEDIRECFEDPKSFARRQPRPTFRSFAEMVSSHDEQAGVKFWADRLKGLESHELLFKDEPSKALHTTNEYRKSIPYSPRKGEKIGFDTVTSTAWALMLSNFARTDDVFFCTIRSCRHMALRGIQDIIGPLWSMVPVRQKLKGSKTISSLLNNIYRDTIDGISHEPFGPEALRQHFGHDRFPQSVLLPQPPQPDFGRPILIEEDGIRHEMRSAEDAWVQTRAPYGFYVMTTPKQGDELELFARYDDNFVTAERATEMVEKYAEILKILWTADWEDLTIHDVCPHISVEASGNGFNGSLDALQRKTLTYLFQSTSLSDDALIVPGEADLTLSHEQLKECVANLQKQLSNLGIQESSAVSIALPNSLELIAIFLASTWQRGIAAPLNPSYKQDEFEFYIEDLGSSLVVIPKGAYEQDGPAVKAARKYDAAIAECSWQGSAVVLDVKERGKLADRKAQDLLVAKEEDVALVLHTSGTTGRPKAVPLNHRNLMSNIANICRTYNLSPEDRTLLIMPLFHVHGLLASFLSPLFSGGSAIVPARLEPSFWDTFNKHSANWYSATPSMHKLILQFPPPDPLPDIRFIRSCSSQLAPSLFKQLKEAFRTAIVESYAMTEASHLMASNPLDGEQKPGSVGKPQGVDMLLLDANNNEVPAGEEGEVSIRGPNVTEGYLNNAEANAKEFTKEGFFRTGDQGKFDEDGYLILTGRLKEMINKGGEKISPVELDNVISRHEAVSEVVTFAIDDEAYGQDIGCAVKTVDGHDLTGQDLKKWIGERLVSAKVPKKIWFCEDIPKTATGKVQRRLVADAMLKSDDHQ